MGFGGFFQARACDLIGVAIFSAQRLHVSIQNLVIRRFFRTQQFANFLPRRGTAVGLLLAPAVGDDVPGAGQHFRTGLK